MTDVTWHVTHDAWHIPHSVGRTFSQNFGSLALPVWNVQCLEDILTKGWMNYWMNQWMNDGGDCITAPAKLGLLLMDTDKNVGQN